MYLLYAKNTQLYIELYTETAGRKYLLEVTKHHHGTQESNKSTYGQKS